MLFNCANCHRCCTHFTKDWMGPYLSYNEAVRFKEFSATIRIGEDDIQVLKPVNNRCPLWSYGGHCTRYDGRPLDCRLYPFMVKNAHIIVHLTCPDAVRMLELLAAGDSGAQAFERKAEDIIMGASKRYLRYLEWQTKDFRFYCVVE